jgi:hypothetical protein
MAIRIPLRTGVVTPTTGTGAYALGDALPTHRTFAQAAAVGWLADGDIVPYWCADAAEPATIEEGFGTYNAGPNTLTRTTIIKSSDSGAAINWSPGNKDLVVGFTSDLLVAILGIANKFTAIQEIECSGARLDLDSLSGDPLLRFLLSGAVRGKVSMLSASGLTVVDSQDASQVVVGRLIVGPGRLEYATSSATSGDAIDRYASGTVMYFGQAAAPARYTKSTAVNDAALRLVSGSGGGTGGTLALSSTVTAVHTLTAAQIPSHTHGLAYATAALGAMATDTVVTAVGSGGSTATTDVGTGGGGSHSHGLALKHRDVIECVKD